METESDKDLFDSTFEYVIFKISENEETINEFNSDTLFMNIYLFYTFSRYLSPYYEWDKKALARLKHNIIYKWPVDDTLCNVFLFIELLSRGIKEVDPTNFFWNSEQYFEYLVREKINLDQLITNIFKTKGKCIR